MQSVTVPATSVTFTWKPDPKYPTYLIISLLGMPVAGMWNSRDYTGLELLDVTSPDQKRDDTPHISVTGPDEAQRITEALTQLAARLFTVPV